MPTPAAVRFGDVVSRRRQYSPAERDAVNARRELLRAAAADAVAGRPADVQRVADVLGGFSLRNAALILIQAEGRGRAVPAAVAGFHEWRRAGRIVRKGSQGYVILAPMTRSADDGGTELRGFRAVHVFDVADTDELVEGSPARLADVETAV